MIAHNELSCKKKIEKTADHQRCILKFSHLIVPMSERNVFFRLFIAVPLECIRMVNPFHFKYTQNKSPQQMGHNGNQPNRKQNAMKIKDKKK